MTFRTPDRMLTRRTALAQALWAPAAAALGGCVPTDPTGSGADRLTIGAFSVVREAFHDGLLPAFRARWHAATGRDVRFEESYNASGAQARAIAAGFDADVAILSHEGDIKILVDAGLVAKDWAKAPDGGIVARSLVVIGHRAGRDDIRDWDDLTRPGVGVLYPDPKTSGGARWNVNAIYGAGLREARFRRSDREPRRAARDLLARVQANVITMDASGRQSMATFGRGTGDAVATYENELLLQAKLTGRPAPYAIPPATLLIENPAALVESSVKRHGNRPLAEAFLAFLRTPEGQGILAEYGFRPADPAIEPPGRRPLPPRLFTMADLGGWSKLKKELYDPGGVWDSLFRPEPRGAKS